MMHVNFFRKNSRISNMDHLHKREKYIHSTVMSGINAILQKFLNSLKTITVVVYFSQRRRTLAAMCWAGPLRKSFR